MDDRTDLWLGLALILFGMGTLAIAGAAHELTWLFQRWRRRRAGKIWDTPIFDGEKWKT